MAAALPSHVEFKERYKEKKIWLVIQVLIASAAVAKR